MPRSEKVKLLKFFSAGCPYRMKFRRFVGLLERLHGVKLVVPTFDRDSGEARLSALKSFCSSLIEGGDHPWRCAAKGLSSDQRKSLAMSLFLFRKVLPSPKPELFPYAEKMGSESVRPDEGFLSFCRRTVRKMFPDGWDMCSYPNACLTSVLPESSCYQRGKGKGGCRSYVLGGGTSWSDHQSFVLETLTRESLPELTPSRLSAVETGGKWRIVSVADAEMNILRPLHLAIYNRLSRFDWLLRGEASVGRFKKFTYQPDQVFVSGDYTSATDNLNFHIQREILGAVLEGARAVPTGVKELAFRSQQIKLAVRRDDKEVVVDQKRGQLMGNLLSFPLLCLVNYLGFRWFGGVERTKGLPVRVNGDDIVFRSSRSVYESWARGVSGAGLTLSPGKTMVDSRYFSLNSTMFVARGTKVKRVPCIRSSAFGFRKPEDPVSSLSGRWARVKKDFPCGKLRRVVLEEEFLRLNTPYIVASRRSVTRGLDLGISPDALKGSNLWKRECWYLALEKEDPLPLSPESAWKRRIPEGWECVRVVNLSKEVMEKSREIGPEFVRLAWTLPDQPHEGELRVREERYRERVALAPEYRPTRGMPWEKKARLLHVSVRNARRYLQPAILRDGRLVRNPFDIVRRCRPSGKRVWLPVGFLHSTSRELKGKDEYLVEDSSELENVRLRLGRKTLWDGTSSSLQLLQVAGEESVVILRDGIAVGPPKFF
nr:MAG: putative RNA-dependent RNA polymerase [Botourmiaviridae sp.]